MLNLIRNNTSTFFVILGIRKVADVPNSANGFPKTQQPPQMLKQVVGQVPPNNHVQTSIAQVVETKMVPIQITLPPQPGTEGGQRVLTIQVPATALQGNQLHKVLTGPVITATMSLPQHLASTMLQQHVNAALNSQQQNLTLGTIVNKSVIQQSDGCVDMEDDDHAASGKFFYLLFGSVKHPLKQRSQLQVILLLKVNNQIFLLH